MRAMATGPKKTKVRLSLPLPVALHARLEKVAEADRRSMKDFAIIALERAIDDFEAAQAAKKK
jgi:hypothetical protein